jgi:intraflagellar transport protein 46
MGFAVEGAYDPSEYQGLNVGGEVKELFQYITRFKPQNIEIEAMLKPFIPEFIPAVGEVDAFLKIPRPDEESE